MKTTTLVSLSIALLLSATACSSSSSETSASASAAAETKTSAPAKASATASASAKPVEAPPADIAFFTGDIPAGVELKLGAGSSNLGFTVKRPEAWQFSGLPGEEMMMISKDGAASIFIVYSGEQGDEAGVRATLKHAPIMGSDYKQLSKNADVKIGAGKWPARTGYGTAQVFGGEGEVYWLRADLTLFLLATKKGVSKETLEEAKAIARSMTAPKAAPP